MTASIFIKTWRRDRRFLSYALRSLEKFASGFSEIVVLVPLQDEPHFRITNFHGARVVWVDEPDDGRGYLRQQCLKCHADEYTNADLIFFLDSDVFVHSAMTPEMFMPHGKPLALIRHWSDAGSALPWKAITEKFLTFDAVFETMAALPIIIDRRVFPLFREYAEAAHGCSIDEYIMRQPGNDFSEFNALMSFAHRFCPYMFSWEIANPATDKFPRILWQRWSWDERGVGQFSDEYERLLENPTETSDEPDTSLSHDY